MFECGTDVGGEWWPMLLSFLLNACARAPGTAGSLLKRRFYAVRFGSHEPLAITRGWL